MNGEYTHRPVLLDECIEALAVKPDGTYVTARWAGRDMP
jgi:16S rRNA C1402 N4-methylase RsmH